ncbi:NAD(P)-binding domain-containing protein [Streptomyces sp. NPDC046978]|uniref:NADPH-dependent F420 reductase n=1 Tax=Streptomyces sp. NPDC046978 TaxID=3154704 RepID=UPI0033C5B3ED
MSNISIIGTGNMARTIGARAIAGGNTVEVMGRDQSKAAGLAKALGGGTTTGEWGTAPAGDIVIVALLYNGVVPAVAQYGDALAGKVIVDICNPFNSTFDGLAHREETSIAQEVAKAAPASASVVKAFNTVFRHVLEKGRPDVFLAGDDAQAKARRGSARRGRCAARGWTPRPSGFLFNAARTCSSRAVNSGPSSGQTTRRLGHRTARHAGSGQ